VWYENPRPKGDPAKDPWRARRIGRHRTHDVEVADLDGDGKPDVVVRGQTGFGHREGHRFFVWKQHAPDRWSSREVRCPEGEGLKLADIDGDGDPDVVTAGRWYENRGDILKGEWAEHVYAPEWKQGDCKVEAGDFNGDGRADVVLSPAEFKGGRHRIAWFEAPADRKRGRWREHVIEPAVESVVHALGVADLNGDGAADVVTARMHQGDPPQEVSVYLNGDSGRKWAKHVISTKGSHNIVLADLDGDGRTDILGANHGGPHQPAEWWRNSTRGEPGADPVFDLPDGFAQQVVAAGLTGATGMAVAPDGRVFVCEQTGALRVVKGGRLLPEPFLKLEVDSYWERGLIGVALDPDFAKNGYVYVCYVAAEPHPHHRVSRFTAAGDKAVPGSEVLLLRGDDQTKLGGSVPAGHQGGGMHFGPDGKLYVAVGEQTAGAPAQRLDTFQGKLLRINPDGSIPEDNPFFRKAKGKYRAIWALGLRNPFGFAFQPGTGRMLINDVGGSRWEEINEGAPGANYGWPASEGPTTRPGHRSPLYAYGEGNKKSIAGGVFYDPPRRQFPEKYLGKYFFAEYMQGWVGVLDPDGGKLVEKFATGLPGPVALALAADGSLYVLNRDAWVKDDAFRPGTGTLHRVFYVQGSGRPGPVVTTPPRDATTVAGGEATFRVEATGPGPLRYRWQKNGRRIDGADAATLTVARAAAG
ncbi:MAG TPA: PQQ-dependent sugar dehydrogenase, partial [Gemmataceae bacterium]